MRILFIILIIITLITLSTSNLNPGKVIYVNNHFYFGTTFENIELIICTDSSLPVGIFSKKYNEDFENFYFRCYPLPNEKLNLVKGKTTEEIDSLFASFQYTPIKILTSNITHPNAKCNITIIETFNGIKLTQLQYDIGKKILNPNECNHTYYKYNPFESKYIFQLSEYGIDVSTDNANVDIIITIDETNYDLHKFTIPIEDNIITTYLIFGIIPQKSNITKIYNNLEKCIQNTFILSPDDFIIQCEITEIKFVFNPGCFTYPIDPEISFIRNRRSYNIFLSNKISPKKTDLKIKKEKSNSKSKSTNNKYKKIINFAKKSSEVLTTVIKQIGHTTVQITTNKKMIALFLASIGVGMLGSNINIISLFKKFGLDGLQYLLFSKFKIEMSEWFIPLIIAICILLFFFILTMSIIIMITIFNKRRTRKYIEVNN